ncbi:MAG: TetR/AcrR family transcriptional regulator [Proteobacteria bacterium]|nr:TetR/AcrR family transcriptional regulator [Pseudomonadota bacterium]
MSEVAVSRREREEEVRREYILDVSEKLFARQGIHDTSVSDIARDAEFGIGTIYKYFKDKNTLIQSLLESRLIAHFSEIEAAIVSRRTPVEGIDGVIGAYLTSVSSRRAFFGVYYTHFHPGPGDTYEGSLKIEFLKEWKLKTIDGIREIFEEGIELGHFIDVDPEYLAAALFGMLISFYFMAERKFSGDWDVVGMRAAMKKILLEKVLIDPSTYELEESASARQEI